jgi:succinate dehydrogenase/fumarate reductase flavoprotein subunit
MPVPQANLTVDVIVVGYGAAGGAAAITAHDQGAETLVLEKMDQPGGNSLVSSANMIFPENPGNADQFADYLHEVNFGTTERELVDRFVAGLMENPAWLQSLGGQLENYDYKSENPSLSYYIPDVTFPALPSAKGLKLVAKRLQQTETCPQPTGGDRLWNLLDRNARSRGIKIMVSTPITELVKNDQGEVIGVKATQEGEEIFIRARKGVILTCGGFENNPGMKWDYLQPKGVGFMGSPGNTGDGIKIAQKAGADLWHMDAEASVLGFQPPEWETGFAITIRKPGFIYVDSVGKRFLDETRVDAHWGCNVTREFDVRTYRYHRLPCYVILDEENAKGEARVQSIFSYNVVMRDYQWSEDNSQEIEKGWIQKADSLEELSSLLNTEETTLQYTLGKYNEFCQKGVDADFGRAKDTLKPIKPPYYVMELKPLLYNTQGGARRDQEARVLDPDGNAIPRLYAAGEFGSIWGFRYQTSTNYSEALIFGRIAGENAALMESVE